MAISEISQQVKHCSNIPKVFSWSDTVSQNVLASVSTYRHRTFTTSRECRQAPHHGRLQYITLRNLDVDVYSGHRTKFHALRCFNETLVGVVYMEARRFGFPLPRPSVPSLPTAARIQRRKLWGHFVTDSLQLSRLKASDDPAHICGCTTMPLYEWVIGEISAAPLPGSLRYRRTMSCLIDLNYRDGNVYLNFSPPLEAPLFVQTFWWSRCPFWSKARYLMKNEMFLFLSHHFPFLAFKTRSHYGTHGLNGRSCAPCVVLS